MGERKVLNKYFPPDFDPNLVPKTKLNIYKQIETRMMLPFNIQCETCGEFMYRGKKFNMRKEDVIGDTYKGIKKFRFYMKCNMCSREITFVTDPENMDYAMEIGAKRLFEVWKEQDKSEKEAAEQRALEEQQDAMKALEHRTIDSKLEMDIMDALEETKALNSKRDTIRPDHLLAMYAREEASGLMKEEEEDEALIQQAFHKGKKEGGGGGRNGGGMKTLDDSDEEKEEEMGAGGGRLGVGGGPTATLLSVVAEKEKGGVSLKPVITIKAKKRKGVGGEEKKEEKKKVKTAVPAPAPAVAAATPAGGGGLGGLLGAYASSSDED